MELPIYKIQISDDFSDDGGIKFVSVVGEPAIEENYLKFSKMMKYTTNDKRIVTGPAIIVDKPIYRNMDGQEFYTLFDKDNTEKLVKKWAIQQKYNAVNAEHDAPVNSMFLFESYLINRERGINPPNEFSDVPDGSWFLSYYVQDDALWERIKKGEFNGFSVEGLFGLEMTNESVQMARDLVLALQEFCATLKEFTS